MSAIRKLTLTKVAVGFIALAMVTGMLFAIATPARAQVSLSELVELFIALDIIPADKASEARAVLQNQQGSGGGMAGLNCPATPFTRDLSQGMSSAMVMDLQEFLNSVDGVSVAASGPGSPGQETQFYGPLTSAAVSQFQMKYSGEVLAPLGLTSGTGYFGASSRAKANALCAGGADMPDDGDVPPPPPPGPGGPGPGDDEDEDEDMDEEEDEDEEEGLSGGEASLEDFDSLSDPSDEDVEEGEEEVQVFGFEFDVEDGDVSVRRIDVRFASTNQNNEDEPWKQLDEVHLWNDGEIIASENADDEDDWSDEGGDIYEMRFSGLNVIYRDGDTAEFIVGVTVSDGIDDNDLDQDWEVWIPDDGVRAIDGAGIDQYIGDQNAQGSADAETFTIETAGADTEMNLSTASSNPDASTINVEDNDTTDDVTVLVFDIEAEDGEITLNHVVIGATTSTTTLNEVINDAKLVIDGVTHSDMEWDDDCDGTTDSGADSGDVQGGCILFDLEDNDEEQTIDKDDEVEAVLMVDFNQTTGNYTDGDTIEFEVDAGGENDQNERNSWEVEDVSGDDVANADKNGTANGEQHTLFDEGIFAEIVSTDATVRTTGDGQNDVVDFEIKFDVTAFDDTFFIASTTANALTFRVQRNGTDVADQTGATTTAPVIESTADEENTNFRVNDGDTETFTFSVTVDPDLTGAYRVILDQVRFSANNTGSANDLTHEASPETDFRTGSKTVAQDN